MKLKKGIDYEEGSDNIFRDLGLPNADELLARSNLIIAIRTVMEKRSLTQAQVAALAGMGQPDVSKMLRGDLKRFTTDRVMQVLNKLGQDIEITIKPAPKRQAVGRTTVKAA
jgi:predicted XRE-type DNA-binding protein